VFLQNSKTEDAWQHKPHKQLTKQLQPYFSFTIWKLRVTNSCDNANTMLSHAGRQAGRQSSVSTHMSQTVQETTEINDLS
jgi:hypothetical protein